MHEDDLSIALQTWDRLDWPISLALNFYLFHYSVAWELPKETDDPV